MDGPLVYLCTLSGLLIGSIAVRVIRYPKANREILPRSALRHIGIPYCLERHRYLGPWTRGDVLAFVTAMVMNIASIVFPYPKDMVSRVGDMALYNLVFTCLLPNLNLYGEILGVSLASSRKLHRLLTVMMGGNLLLHILLGLIPDDTGSAIKSVRGIWGVGVRIDRILLC